MKKIHILAATLLWLCLAAPALAADFLGAPLPEGGVLVKDEAERIERSYDQPAPALYKYFQDTLKGQKDLKFREVRGDLVVEDFGDRHWHKISVTPDGPSKSTLVITKDSWSWIVGMLALRFTGVFIVLLVLYFAMSLATFFIHRSLSRGKAGMA